MSEGKESTAIISSSLYHRSVGAAPKLRIGLVLLHRSHCGVLHQSPFLYQIRIRRLSLLTLTLWSHIPQVVVRVSSRQPCDLHLSALQDGFSGCYGNKVGLAGCAGCCTGLMTCVRWPMLPALQCFRSSLHGASSTLYTSVTNMGAPRCQCGCCRAMPALASSGLSLLQASRPASRQGRGGCKHPTKPVPLRRLPANPADLVVELVVKPAPAAACTLPPQQLELPQVCTPKASATMHCRSQCHSTLPPPLQQSLRVRQCSLCLGRCSFWVGAWAFRHCCLGLAGQKVDVGVRVCCVPFDSYSCTPPLTAYRSWRPWWLWTPFTQAP